MPKKPLVTIITPVFNSAKYIRQCIESVLQQTYPNWELLLIDDCSSDESLNIINEYMISDKRIKLFKNKVNFGPAKSRNIGLDNAKGEYICFLDSDDFLDKNKIELQINYMLSNKYLMTHGSFKFCSEQGDVLKKISVDKTIDYFRLLKGNQFKIMTPMINKNIINGLKFQDIKHEDYIFFLDVLKKISCSYLYDEESHSFCRIRELSVSSNKIKSAIWTWNVYFKHENLGFLKSLFYFINYMINGIIKYKF